MVLGAIWCPLKNTQEISFRLHEIKERHGLNRDFEMKWTKVSPAKLRFYMDAVDYFFDDDDLHFRALVVPDKSNLPLSLRTSRYNDLYYKIHFDMLKVILNPNDHYRIYLDIKDTFGVDKAKKLKEVLLNDFSRDIVERVQIVRSHEVAVMQLADLLIGAVAYANRGITTSAAKRALVARMEQRARYRLTQSTLWQETKVNLVQWEKRS